MRLDGDGGVGVDEDGSEAVTVGPWEIASNDGGGGGRGQGGGGGRLSRLVVALKELSIGVPLDWLWGWGGRRLPILVD